MYIPKLILFKLIIHLVLISNKYNKRDLLINNDSDRIENGDNKILVN